MKVFKIIKVCTLILIICFATYEIVNLVEIRYGNVDISKGVNTIKKNISELIDDNIIGKIDKENLNKIIKERDKLISNTKKIGEKAQKKDEDKKEQKMNDDGKYVYSFSKPMSELAIDGGSSVTLSASDEEQLKQQIYRGFLFRKDTINIEYSGDNIEKVVKRIKEIVNDILLRYDNTKTANDFDYLNNDIRSMNFSTRWNILNAKITISARYLDNADQQSYVDGRVKGILKELHIKKRSRYKRVKLIHDWIVKNVEYDKSQRLHSAYAGLRQKKTVCQGYAMLTYKMLTEAGIKCRIISGKADNGSEIESHAWNLVNLNGKWYYLDTTWDDGTNSYKYFLIGSNKMSRDHFGNDRFTSKQFRKKYKISKQDY